MTDFGQNSSFSVSTYLPQFLLPKTEHTIMDDEHQQPPPLHVHDPSWITAVEAVSQVCFPFALRTALQLDVFQILADSAPDCPLSAHDILARIPHANHFDSCSASLLDRLLRLLASHSLLTCSLGASGRNVEGESVTRYGLAPASKWFHKDKLTGTSLTPLCYFLTSNNIVNSWYQVHDVILEGGNQVPFTRTHGKDFFRFIQDCPSFMELFHVALAKYSALYIRAVLEVYNGFGSVRCLVDVGGGIGSTLNGIISKHPHIQGINFDLPHIVASAPQYQGSIQHVGGDMFEAVPSGDGILLKTVLHNWDDEQCLKILRNCHRALPENGKLIVMEPVLPSPFETFAAAREAYYFDVMGMLVTSGGRERTEQELNELAVAAGFCGCKLVCRVNEMAVVELRNG